MKERPILFSAPMVRAILAGEKTQTRRVVKPQPSAATTHWWCIIASTERGEAGKLQPRGCGSLGSPANPTGTPVRCPYGLPGDRLWVRETWSAELEWPDDYGLSTEWWHRVPQGFRGPRNAVRLHFAADQSAHDVERISPPHEEMGPADIGLSRCDEREDAPPRWLPSIHMPRWASRITLEVTGVRVERLQEISTEDCIAEGLSTKLREHDAVCDLREQYQGLWESINGAKSWDLNPWVWAITFRRVGG